ncbi:MAG: hypothetical protein AB1791_23615 [Chloroflexota bacterium]
MRLDRKKQKELARRKGQTWRAILELLWLGAAFVIAYYVSEWLFDTGAIRYPLFSGSSGWLPRWVVQAGVMGVLVLVMHFFIYFGFFLASYEGRKRPANPSLYSRDPEPTERED